VLISLLVPGIVSRLAAGPQELNEDAANAGTATSKRVKLTKIVRNQCLCILELLFILKVDKLTYLDLLYQNSFVNGTPLRYNLRQYQEGYD
jgi:hypothetical protein